jgi:acetyltransferase-like isoleucine patch superfamily enzyme
MLRSLVQTAGKLRDLWHIRRDPVGYARSIGVAVGEDCRLIDLTRATFGTEPYLVRLGNHVTVTSEVNFITHDGGVWVRRRDHPDADAFAPIVVGNNVFIGFRSILMPGATIGDNCVIGAGSVVTRSIPPNSVAAGVPAKVIRSTDEYWERLQPRLMHVRSLPYEEKRRRVGSLLPRQP